MRFGDLTSTWLVLQNVKAQRGIEIEWLEVQVLSDLSPITLRKRSAFRFLTTRPAKEEIWYRWGSPVKLFVNFKSTR